MNLKASGECIKRNRMKQGIRLEELSNKTGIDIQKLQEFEEGQYKPQYSMLMKISRALKIPPLIIMRGGGRSCVSDEDGKIIYKQF